MDIGALVATFELILVVVEELTVLPIDVPPIVT
jgi:hypothetical protein